MTWNELAMQAAFSRGCLIGEDMADDLLWSLTPFPFAPPPKIWAAIVTAVDTFMATGAWPEA